MEKCVKVDMDFIVHAWKAAIFKCLLPGSDMNALSSQIAKTILDMYLALRRFI